MMPAVQLQARREKQCSFSFFISIFLFYQKATARHATTNRAQQTIEYAKIKKYSHSRTLFNKKIGNNTNSRGRHQKKQTKH
jgi:hypothetical protein